MEDMRCEIYHDDYRKVAERLAQAGMQVDAVVTDPPYNVSRDYQLGFSNMGRAGMNYGEWDYDFDQTAWIEPVAQLVKPGGATIIFNDWKNLGEIAHELERLNFIIKDVIRWVKRNPMPRNVERRYVTDCEYALWAVKTGKPWTFNKPADQGYLKPMIETGVVPGGKKRLHPTQKHLDVIERLVAVHTNPGDVVFDPFLGSGTTAVACKKLERGIIGAEIDEKYYKISLERIQTA